MTKKRATLYDRLPEIYRLRDEEQRPPGVLKSYVGVLEEVFDAIRVDIEALYDDLFIDTCREWVIPYIGDLLGVTRLSGDPWTLRAEAADTVALRRTKGTKACIRKLTADLTAWPVHCVELRENLAWMQHLNHQRLTVGHTEFAAGPSGPVRRRPARGGTAPVCDPALLSLRGTPFDPLAHIADLRPPAPGAIAYNLPNLAIYMWRLRTCTIPLAVPVIDEGSAAGTSVASGESVTVCCHIHPLARPVRLFNRERDTRAGGSAESPPDTIDGFPGPIPLARLCSGATAGNPEAYVAVHPYERLDEAVVGEEGLQIHLPAALAAGEWTFRGAALCDWEGGIFPALKDREIAVDPELGRIAVGVADEEDANVVREGVRVTFTYGTVGTVGAHGLERIGNEEDSGIVHVVGGAEEPDETLADAIARLPELEALVGGDSATPLTIEIADSFTHDLAPDVIRLSRPLVIRAAAGHRPILRLGAPLRFRADRIVDAEESVARSRVRLEGLYITGEIDAAAWRTGGYPAAFITMAAVNRLEMAHCTLDPGGYERHGVRDPLTGAMLHGTRAPTMTSLWLTETYGLSGDEREAFRHQIPEIVIENTITGPLRIDRPYSLSIKHSIVDAGNGVGVDVAAGAYGILSTVDDEPGPPLHFEGITVLGRTYVERLGGAGGIWSDTVEVLDNQDGCVRQSCFHGTGNRLPTNYACVGREDVHLSFESECFGHPAYGRLSPNSGFTIRERGPGDDAMGAFGFLKNAHRLRNVAIRYREYMPADIRPVLVPVT